jgi:hypothetical protein
MGDGAPLAAIEFLGAEPAEPPKGKGKARTAEKGEVTPKSRRRRGRRGKRAGTVAATASPSGSEG